MAQKNPDRFAEDSFSSACNTHFLEWLNGHAGHDRADLAIIPETTPPHRRPKLLLYKAFVQACQATQDPIARANAFKQVIALRDDLSQANRTVVQNYWLCAAAWCAKFEPSAVENLDWQADWRQFLKRRNGRLPCWMQKLAQRLALHWPE